VSGKGLSTKKRKRRGRRSEERTMAKRGKGKEER
jgi:hypothetical protein